MFLGVVQIHPKGEHLGGHLTARYSVDKFFHQK